MALKRKLILEDEDDYESQPLKKPVNITRPEEEEHLVEEDEEDLVEELEIDGDKDDKEERLLEVEEEDQKDYVVEDYCYVKINSEKSRRRIWHESDEMRILEGMIEFHSIKHKDISGDMSDFYDFIKGSLQIDPSRKQFVGKIKRLKEKFQGKVKRARNGKKLFFLNPHERDCFLLSKQLWGKEGDNDIVDQAMNDYDYDYEYDIANENPRINNDEDDANENPRINNDDENPRINNDEDFAKENHRMDDDDDDDEDNDDGDRTCNNVSESAKEKVSPGPGPGTGTEQKDFWSLYPCLDESLKLEEFSPHSVPGSAISLVKERMCSIGGSKARELEDKWRRLQLAEIEVKLMRVQLIKEQTKVILDLIC